MFQWCELCWTGSVEKVGLGGDAGILKGEVAVINAARAFRPPEPQPGIFSALTLAAMSGGYWVSRRRHCLVVRGQAPVVSLP